MHEMLRFLVPNEELEGIRALEDNEGQNMYRNHVEINVRESQSDISKVTDLCSYSLF